MKRAALSLFTLAALVVTVTASGCPGRGNAGEGEGEGDAGEGEGDAGEGEGEGDAGEGEGEGDAGEGEGEGDVVDEAGEADDPLAVPLAVGTDVDVDLDINPVRERDCFAFTTAASLHLHAETSGSCQSSTTDTDLFLIDGAGRVVAHNDDATTGDVNTCSVLDLVIPQGDWVVCVAEHLDDDIALDLHVTLQLGDVLGDGAACDPLDSAAVCDSTLALACVDDGVSGAHCTNPDAFRCVNAVAFAGGTGQLPADSATSDTADNQCGSGGNDVVLRYVVQGTRERVTFQGTGVASVEVRTACDRPDTSIACASGQGGTAIVPDVVQGQELFVLIDGDDVGDSAFSVSVLEDDIHEIQDGDECQVDDDLGPCAAGLVCAAASSTLSECAAPLLERGTLTVDPHYLRQSLDCSSSLGETVPFRVYTVTNEGGAGTQVTAFTQNHALNGAECDPDTVLFAYAHPFNPASPEAGCALANDDGPDGVGFHCSSLAGIPLAASGNAGDSVDIVVAGFDGTEIGDYELGLLTPGTTVSVVAGP